MSHVTTTIIVLLFIALMFIPLAYLSTTYQNVQSVKQTLNLSAKSLNSAIDFQIDSSVQLSSGYSKRIFSEKKVDKQELVSAFYTMIQKNAGSKQKADKLKENILTKVLVYPDRIYIADNAGRWSAPYFFVHHVADTLIYVNTENDYAYEEDSTGSITRSPIVAYGLTTEQKNDLIIDTINHVIAKHTYYKTQGKAYTPVIRNPDTADIEYQLAYGHFNVLKGITFLVLYVENTHWYADRVRVDYRNYNVTGFTLERY